LFRSAGLHSLGEGACLRRALLLHGWLRRRGLQPVLQLGVPAEGGAAFRAHAWVELEGAPLLASDAGYRPFKRASASPGQA
ncbi:MAG: lasso peptide biosynthesis B2 protein, partial [Burkholderiales bacterium]|nr:lasso peptide biosynthesis B2 protein [Burkholderiales bacterium]